MYRCLKDCQVFATDLGVLYRGDCLGIMQFLDDNSIDCVFADPPFNLDKNYKNGRSDNLDDDDYINWSMKWLNECIRVLRPGGALLVYNIPRWCVYYSRYLIDRLQFVNWICVDVKNGMPIKNRYSPAHYGLLYFVKDGGERIFNKQRIPIQTCRHCGGEIKDYGGHRDRLNKSGLGLSDVWTDIYPVRKKKHRKNNELSIKLMERILSCHTNPEDVILDPFGGTGTTYVVAELLNRHWIGIEIGDCEVIKNRFEDICDDKNEIKKIKECNGLFTNRAIELRKRNGFWL